MNNQTRIPVKEKRIIIITIVTSVILAQLMNGVKDVMFADFSTNSLIIQTLTMLFYIIIIFIVTAVLIELLDKYIE